MSFKESRTQHQGVPTAWEVPVADGEAFEIGALGTLVDGEFTESTSPDPDDATHISQTPYGAATADFTVPIPMHLGHREFPPGKAIVTEILATKWRCKYLGDLPAATGGLYGLTRDTDGLWKLDFDTVTGDLVARYLRPLAPDVSGITAIEVEVEFLAAPETVE